MLWIRFNVNALKDASADFKETMKKKILININKNTHSLDWSDIIWTDWWLDYLSNEKKTPRKDSHRLFLKFM